MSVGQAMHMAMQELVKKERQASMSRGEVVGGGWRGGGSVGVDMEGRLRWGDLWGMWWEALLGFCDGRRLRGLVEGKLSFKG